MEWELPAKTSAQSVAMPICVGVERVVVVPSPSWELVLTPQAQSVPLVFRASVWLEPALIRDQFVAVPI